MSLCFLFLRWDRLCRGFNGLLSWCGVLGSGESIDGGGSKVEGGLGAAFPRGWRRGFTMGTLTSCSGQLSPLPVVEATGGSLIAVRSNGCQRTLLDLRSFAFY
jgi:hypothetical protein